MAGVEDLEPAVGESLGEELGVGERDDVVVTSREDGDRGGDSGQQRGKRGQLLGVPADVAHRLGEAVADIAGHVVRADVLGDLAGVGFDGSRDNDTWVHPAVLLEVRVEDPGRQRFTQLQGDRGRASADDQAGDAIGMVRCREQCGRSADVRPDDVRHAELGLIDQPRQEGAHGAGGHQVVPAIGPAEAR